MNLVHVIISTLLFSTLCLSCAPTRSSSMVVYSVPEDFDFEDTKDNLEMAILGEGLKVSKTLKLDTMLERTGPELGYPNKVYHKAESLEFCSASLAHQMATIDPSNLAVCPFTILVFSTTQKPEKIYLAFRRPKLEGAASELERAMLDMLETIVKNTLE